MMRRGEPGLADLPALCCLTWVNAAKAHMRQELFCVLATVFQKRREGIV